MSDTISAEKIAPEMRIFSPDGERLYLNADERKRFLEVVRLEADRDAVLFCTLLNYTGCRPTELRELTVDRVNIDESQITIRSLKKRKFNNQGERKQPHFRDIPIPPHIMNMIVLGFDIRKRQNLIKKRKGFLWPSDSISGQPVDAATAYRWVKRNMTAAGIEGKRACAKGLRHGLGVHLVTNNVPITVIKDVMGHTDTKTTEIYLQVMGGEKKSMILDTWKTADE